MKIEHGKEYFIWNYHYGKKKHLLAMTNLDRCDKCNQPSTVNCVWIVNNAPSGSIEQANKIKEKYGELTELGADSEGNCYCEKCYDKHAVLE